MKPGSRSRSLTLQPNSVMAFPNSMHGFPPDEPDMNTGLQMSTTNEEVFSRFGSASLNSPKKTPADELLHMRAELEQMRTSRNQAQAAADAMAVDLMTAQEEIEEKDARMHNMAEDIVFWREKVVTNGTSDEGILMCNVLADRLEANSTGPEVQIRNDDELMQARQQVQHLTAALAENNAMLEAKEVNMVDNEELEVLRKLVNEQECKLNDQLQCVEHFRRMSERLTTHVKQAHREKQELERVHAELLQSQMGGVPIQQGAAFTTDLGPTY
ncbi:hypothetical protein LTR56_000847 [Elasticomyces elasticus]|nr:hypothetical protein LTR22_018626 [Elasticomyces elasticus]KAK3660471.1 hypothetical protein LTR56_000847 [Elasticomyces elasticus]KAK4912273.1 hypothetical protein LTR49_019274 [Elasticomyces elasticus]KAK5751793.1 hypothetical protein LTS12_018121 [Elasticomyces elasticus]